MEVWEEEKKYPSPVIEEYKKYDDDDVVVVVIFWEDKVEEGPKKTMNKFFAMFEASQPIRCPNYRLW